MDVTSVDKKEEEVLEPEVISPDGKVVNTEHDEAKSMLDNASDEEIFDKTKTGAKETDDKPRKYREEENDFDKKLHAK